MATGLYSAGVEVGSVGALTGTGYGRVLLVKGALVVVAGGLGLANAAQMRGWWLGFARGGIPSRASGRLFTAEAVAGAVLLLAAGVLVETPPSRVDTVRPAAPVPVGDSAAVQDIVVSVSVTPDRPGGNGFTVLAVSGRRSVTYTVTATPVNGFSGDLTLALTGLNTDQASWTITPQVIVGGSVTAQVTITTAATLTPGTYPLTITGTSGPLSRTVPLSLVVTGPPDFTLGVTPTSRTVVAGSGATYTVAVSALNGFTGAVGLSLPGLPTTVGSATFTPASIDVSGTATLSIATRMSHQAPATLVVT